jgi:hypothetical protein
LAYHHAEILAGVPANGDRATVQATGHFHKHLTAHIEMLRPVVSTGAERSEA